MNGLMSKRRRHSLAPEWWRLNTDNNLFMRHLASMSCEPLVAFLLNRYATVNLRRIIASLSGCNNKPIYYRVGSFYSACVHDFCSIQWVRTHRSNMRDKI